MGSGITEQHIQALLMTHVSVKMRHPIMIPGAKSLLPYETDMCSITRGGLLHEFEIKLNVHDYEHDSTKAKHVILPVAKDNSPAFYWYVTYGFSIEPPKYAGWLLVGLDGKITVGKEAPKLNDWKVPDDKIRYIATSLSSRMARLYLAVYFGQKP